MDIWLALGLIGGMLGAIVILGLIILLIVKLKNKREYKNSMPLSGTDRSDFAKNIQSKYRNESRLN
jgi:hypothetical protein